MNVDVFELVPDATGCRMFINGEPLRDVIKTADHVIDLGPEGGVGGGRVIAHGTPESIAADDRSATGRFLRDILGPNASSSRREAV